MGAPAALEYRVEREVPRQDRVSRPQFQFRSLVLTAPESLQRERSATLSVSLVIHAIFLTAILLLPILWDSNLPAAAQGVRAFFVTPTDLTPPPPPPPPPAGPRDVRRVQVARPPVDPARFSAPIEIPTSAPLESGIDFGVEGGVPGGVEGGIPGGVVGGIVGGILATEPPPPPTVVRVGGKIVAPKLIRRVNPAYPALARQARIKGAVVLEARVDVNGFVKSLTVLDGNPLLQDAAREAVTQWRYQPLLLNGIPTEFILTVNIVFNLTGGMEVGVP